MKLVTLALLCFALPSCKFLSTPMDQWANPIRPRKVAFDEAEYAPYALAGTGVIEGQAFMTQRNGGVVVGAGRTVSLNPATSYAQEWLDRDVIGYESLESPDPRAKPFNRTAVADADGRFRFDSLPPGTYILACRIVWEAPAGMHLEETGGVAYATVKVEDGKTTHAVVTR